MFQTHVQYQIFQKTGQHPFEGPSSLYGMTKSDPLMRFDSGLHPAL